MNPIKTLCTTFVSITAIALTSTSWVLAEGPKAKYAPTTERLYQSRDFIKKNAAPDYWALSPYYMPQQDSSACGLASLSIVFNGIRATTNLTASDQLVTQKNFMKMLNHSVLKKGKGVTLDQLGEIAGLGLKKYGFANGMVEVVHAADERGATAFKQQLIAHLEENEASDRNFIIANFLQSEYTGDPEGAVGHIAPIGAYDAGAKKVLVLDPDREYYEPYWVSLDTFIKGMSTVDKTAGKTRGYVFLRGF